MPEGYVLLIAGAAIAGFVQGISGFAFGMVSMAVWVWGIDPRTAVILGVSGGLTGQIVSAIRYPRPLTMETLAPYLAGGLLGVPIGVLILPYLSPAVFKLVLGLLLAVCCSAMLMTRRLPKISGGGRFADGLAGAAGGIMGGIGGFTAAIPSLWGTLRGYDKTLQRNVIQNFNTATLTVTLLSYGFSGALTSEILTKYALVVPALLIPSLIGERIHRNLSELAARNVVLWILTLAGVIMVVSSLVSLWPAHRA